MGSIATDNSVRSEINHFFQPIRGRREQTRARSTHHQDRLFLFLQQYFFTSTQPVGYSAKSLSINPTRASTACSASSPLARMVNSLPCSAASVRMDRMLFPSTRFPSFAISMRMALWTCAP